MRRTITMPDTLYERLQNLSEKRCISIASIIKLACIEYLEKAENQSNSQK